MDETENEGHVKVGATTRSGDTHVIDPTVDDAVAVNVDALAREAAATEAVADVQRELKKDDIAAELDRLVQGGFAEAYDPKLKKDELAQLLVAALEREAAGTPVTKPPEPDLGGGAGEQSTKPLEPGEFADGA